MLLILYTHGFSNMHLICLVSNIIFFNSKVHSSLKIFTTNKLESKCKLYQVFWELHEY